MKETRFYAWPKIRTKMHSKFSKIILRQKFSFPARIHPPFLYGRGTPSMNAHPSHPSSLVHPCSATPPRFNAKPRAMVWPLLTMVWPLLTMDRPLLTMEWPLLTMEWPLLTMVWPLLTMDRPLLTMEWPLLTMEWPLLTMEWPLLTMVWPLLTMEWPLLTMEWPLLTMEWTPCLIVRGECGNALALAD